MNILTNTKNLKLILIASVSSAISTLAFAPQAQAAQFSFEEISDGTNSAQTFWNHGNSSSNGWSSGALQGTATKDNITLTVESVVGGTAERGPFNLRIQDQGSTDGFVLNNINGSDDQNVSSLDNYQRINLTFNKPVILETFTFADIDTGGSNSTGFVDALGAEGFTNGIGSIGTGIDPNFDIVANELFEKNLSGVNFVSRNSTRNVQPEDPDPEVAEVGISFDEGVTTVSLYFFNDIDNTAKTTTNAAGDHSINLLNSTISVQEVPFEFSPTLGLVLSGTVFLGLKIRQGRKAKSQQIIETE